MRPFDYAFALLQIPNNHGLDYILTAAFTALGTLVTIVGHLIKKRMEVYDKHLDECRERAVTIGRMEQRLIAVESEIAGIRKYSHWVGNCIVTIGAKLGVELPDRP